MAILMANTEHLLAFQRRAKYNINFLHFLEWLLLFVVGLYSWNNLYIFILCFIYPRDSTLLPLLLLPFYINTLYALPSWCFLSYYFIVFSFLCFCCWHKISKRLCCIKNLTIQFISISFNNNTRNNRFCITWESSKL